MILFPFYEVEKGCKIALYGAGQVGQNFFTQVEGTKYCKVEMWVDKNFMKYRSDFLPVYPIECLSYGDFDIVIICIIDLETARNIALELNSMGISMEKILWNYRRRNFELWNAQEIYKEDHKAKINEVSSTSNTKKKIWIMNTPYHGNIGDYAIAISEEDFFCEYFPEYSISNISSAFLEKNMESLKEYVGVEDIIFITGGGFMGILWQEEDKRAHSIVEQFPNNKIIFMPQTFFYGDDEEKIKQDQFFYSNHKNVMIIHREKNSYNFFKGSILNDDSRVFFAPDMVCYLSYNMEHERIGIGICLREDKESVFTKSDRSLIENIINESGNILKDINTVYDFEIEHEMQRGTFENKLKEFSSCRLVITDRLHGMLFSFITKTPCIVLANVSKKNEGVYDWIKECNYIIFENEICNIERNIVYFNNHAEIKTLDFQREFRNLKDELDNWIDL